MLFVSGAREIVPVLLFESISQQFQNISKQEIPDLFLVRLKAGEFWYHLLLCLAFTCTTSTIPTTEPQDRDSILNSTVLETAMSCAVHFRISHRTY